MLGLISITSFGWNQSSEMTRNAKNINANKIEDTIRDHNTTILATAYKLEIRTRSGTHPEEAKTYNTDTNNIKANNTITLAQIQEMQDH